MHTPPTVVLWWLLGSLAPHSYSYSLEHAHYLFNERLGYMVLSVFKCQVCLITYCKEGSSRYLGAVNNFLGLSPQQLERWQR
jgi:hypothetical protein